MKKIGLNECRTLFLDFFESRDHLRLKSFSLIPEDDPSLLLINAGMAPLKLYFLGEKKMAKNRATSSQCCLRTADIDHVGKTARHGTFFEMLGNFSFGDYFKKEAIHWAWTFLTSVIELDPDRLWISVYKDDEEAYRIWTEEVGFPKERILKLGKEDNFWELDQGPCGPCSEIHYDRGPKYGPGKDPTENSDRFMEVWNLVFTQFNRQADGTTYVPLKHGNIDTGMGLERLALLTEDRDNIFDLDEFLPLRAAIETLSGKKYGRGGKVDESMRIIIDHAKAMTFLVHDGVIPSNEGRGYILRRLIRRAYRHGKLLGIQGDFLTKAMDQVIPVYRAEYPGLEEAKERIYQIVVREEENFQKTIDQGLALLEEKLDALSEASKTVLSGADAFQLYDTFGFPLDLTQEITAERGIQVDVEDFQRRMQAQKDQSRKARKAGHAWEDSKTLDLSAYPATQFIGYDRLEGQAQVLALFRDGQPVDQLTAGEAGQLLLDETPFYGEGGGQIGDRGQVLAPRGQIQVADTSKDKDEHYLHAVRVEAGSIARGDLVETRVDALYRHDITLNHSATHLLNQALRRVLGDHINQAGSLVTDQRLRFDFTHYEGLSQEALQEIEAMVNRAIYDSYPVTTKILDRKEALAEGAIGIFEDKYKDQVRVVSMGDFSRELCGGTHVENTAQIGSFRILSEQGISSGVRRIEALTGRAAYQASLSDRALLREAKSLVKAGSGGLLERLSALQEEKKELERKLAAMEGKLANDLSKKLSETVQQVGPLQLIARALPGKTMAELKDTVDALKEGRQDTVIVLAAPGEDKVSFVVSMDESAVSKGAHAGKLVQALARLCGGNGGGRPAFATAGGKDPKAVEKAIAACADLLREQIQ